MDHVAERLLRDGKESSLALADVRRDLRFKGDCIYSHARLRINYTTYDVRRSQDVITVDSDKTNIMMLPDDSDQDISPHPFRYARVLRVFHANVSHPTLAPKLRRLDLLWVRWFQTVSEPQPDWDRTDLEEVAFVSASEDGAFGFVDPSQVLRAAHIAPAFEDGRTNELLGPSIFRPRGGDYAKHYVLESVHTFQRR